MIKNNINITGNNMNLRKYLEKKGIKLSFFAKQLGICYPTLYRYMTDDNPIPRHIALAIIQLTEGKVKHVKDKKQIHKD